MASQNTNSSDSSCCRTCRADVEMSKNTIHGPPDDLYAHLTRVNGYPDDSSPFKEEFNVAKSCLKQLSATIALLEAERSRLVGIVEKYKVILHPIRTAPVDVLRHIFDLCVDRTDGHVDLPPEFQNSLVPSRMPWVLGQICRGWRSLALSTPQLWTGVSLDIRQVEAISQESMTADVHRLGLQLHRSQNLPLIVSISSEKVKLQHNTASGPLHITSEVLLNIHPMLVLLCAFSERWKHLQLKGKSQGVQRVFSTRGLLPRLESLIMDLDETPNQASDFATCFEFAPQLTSISLHTLSSMTLPWGQIQHFRFRRRLVMFRRNPLTDSDKLCAIIRGLSNVKVCELDFDPGFSVSDMMATTSTSGRITTHLITLMVSGSLSTDPGTGRDRGDAVIPHFLEGISTPRLSDLRITSPFAGWDELLSLLRRSGCRLTVLMIPLARSLYPETLSEVLSTVPYLKTLEIGFATAMAGNISDNHIRTFSSPEVPRLEKLSIVRHPKHKLSYADSVLVDALEYRWKLAEDTVSGASRLRFVSLDRRITDKRSRERLDVLIAQGMAIDEHDG